MDHANPHVEPPSRPPTELDVAVTHSTISHLLSLDLLSLSTIQKDAFHAAMAVLQLLLLIIRLRFSFLELHIVLLRYFLLLSK